MKNIFKNFCTYTFTALVIFTAAPTHAMMGRLRTGIARVTEQATAVSRSSLFAKHPALTHVRMESSKRLPLLAPHPKIEARITESIVATLLAGAVAVELFKEKEDGAGKGYSLFEREEESQEYIHARESLRKALRASRDTVDPNLLVLITNLSFGDKKKLTRDILHEKFYKEPGSDDEQNILFCAILSLIPDDLILDILEAPFYKAVYSVKRWIPLRSLKKLDDTHNPHRVTDLIFQKGSVELQLHFWHMLIDKTGFGKSGLSSEKETAYFQNTKALFVKEVFTSPYNEWPLGEISNLFKAVETMELPKKAAFCSALNQVELLLLFLFFEPRALSAAQTTLLLNDHADKIIDLGEVIFGKNNIRAKDQLPYWPQELIFPLATHYLEKRDAQNSTTIKYTKGPFITALIERLSPQEQTQWHKLYYRHLYNPLTNEESPEQPLFRQSFNHEQLNEPLIKESTANLCALVPLITEYAQEEYKKGNIVLFHGQSQEWMFLQTLWQFLKAFKTGVPYDREKIDLRFFKHSSLSESKIAYLREKGFPSYNDAEYREHGLFGNLHLFGNLYDDIGSSSWYYITHNFDQSTKRNDSDFFQRAIKSMFLELDMEEEYYSLFILKGPDLFINLKDTFNASAAEQGNFGNLLAVSMPPDVAEKFVYSAAPGGFIRPLTLNGKKTTSVVDAARNPTQLPRDNEWVIILSEEMINPEKREEAGIKIAGFDPVKYWQTSSYLKFEEQLQKELIEPLRNMRTQKTQNKGEQS